MDCRITCGGQQGVSPGRLAVQFGSLELAVPRTLHAPGFTSSQRGSGCMYKRTAKAASEPQHLLLHSLLVSRTLSLLKATSLLTHRYS